jgi:hypothetical protein
VLRRRLCTRSRQRTITAALIAMASCFANGLAPSAVAATAATFSMSCATLAAVCSPNDHLKVTAALPIAADSSAAQKAEAVAAAEAILNGSVIEFVDRDTDRSLGLGGPLRTNVAAERLFDLRPILASGQRSEDVRALVYEKDSSTIALRLKITPKGDEPVWLPFALDMAGAYKDGTVGLLLGDAPRCESPSSNGSAVPCEIGTTLVLPIVNLQQWLAGSGRPLDAVNLQLNEVAMSGVQGFSEALQLPKKVDGGDKEKLDASQAEARRHELRFKLQRDLSNAASRKSWGDLLATGDGSPIDMKVSVGVDSKHWTYGKPASLVLARGYWLVGGVFVLAVAFVVLANFLPLWGGAKGTTLRATNVLVKSKVVYDALSPAQKDALKKQLNLTFLPPHSLSRLQMALWIVTVTIGFVLLWILTKSGDLLNSTALALIGISAGSMVFAQVIDFPTDADKEIDTNLAAVLTTYQAGTSTVADVDPKLIAAREAGLLTTNHFARDIFAEKGTTRSDLHRVQLAAFTVFYFVVYVLSLNESLALPEFSTNTLALLGISSASYLGFKIGAS